MTYAQLKAFHAVAIEGTFQKAAQRLYLTQSAVSIQLRNLQRDSKRNLFRRVGHMFQLTEEGHTLFEWTNRMFRAETNAKLFLTGASDQFHGSLILGSDGPHVGLDLIVAFRKLAPNVEVELVLANAQQTWNNVLDLTVDAAVVCTSIRDHRVITQVISRHGLVALLPRGHELADHDSLDLEQLMSFPLIFREAGSNTQWIVEHAFAEHNLQPRPTFVLGSRECVYEAVMRGMGIGFVLDQELGRDPRCVGVGIRGYESSSEDMLVCLEDQRTNPYVEALFEAIDTIK